MARLARALMAVDVCYAVLRGGLNQKKYFLWVFDIRQDFERARRSADHPTNFRLMKGCNLQMAR